MDQWLAKLNSIIDALFRTNGHRVVSIPVGDPAALREDQQLTQHFSLYELTATANASLQQENRMLTDSQVSKLMTLAQHAENIRSIVNMPVVIHSGYRCDALNGVIPGSSSTSQHPRCEALDLAVEGQSVDDTFNVLLAEARSGNFQFGQLIIEEASRSYGVVRWVHCSVIGTLDPTKIGQVLKMEAGIDGQPHYTLVDKLNF